MATRSEKDTTRARANILREMLTRSDKENPFAHEEIYEVMDLCLSCKGCASECPSNVNVASLKAEFLYQYYQTHGVPLRSRAIANVGRLNQLGSILPGFTNFFLNGWGSALSKQVLGMAPQRSLPPLNKISLRKWYKKHIGSLEVNGPSKGKVYFFCDEFSNFLDTEIGITALKLLTRLGYEVEMPRHAESGRAHLSKGLLKAARGMAMHNVAVFESKVTEDTPLIGLEPSAILGFRDEYPRLVDMKFRGLAEDISEHTFLIDEFLAKEIQKGNISNKDFTNAHQRVLLHGHCHQKALSNVRDSAQILSLPQNYEVDIIPSGCCGMAGSFGYEKEHYEVSMKIGELILFPTVREAEENVLIAAPGTSCRHQIYDGTKRTALHPVEVLWQALS